MSRIGRLPIPVPSGVDIEITDREVTVKGPKGTLTLPRAIVEPTGFERAEDGSLVATRPDDEKRSKERHGLGRTLVANMVIGVTGSTTDIEITLSRSFSLRKITVRCAYGQASET